MAKKQKKDGGEPIDSVVRISKLKTNYKLTYDYNQRLSEFIKTLPREHWSVKVENTVINGKEKDIWSRVISEVEMGKVISFLMDNGLSFKFENVAEDDLNRLRREYLERQNKIAEILRLKAESLDVSDEDFSFLKRQPYDYQKQAVKFFELNNGSGILGDQPGVGKMSKLTTPIATPEGWVKMGDLKKGQLICHHDGGAYPVTGIFPQGKMPSYKITFNDDFSTDCGLEHLWLVRDVNRRRRGTGWVVRSLQEIIDAGLEYTHNDKRAASGRKPVLKWEIPMVQPIQYPEKQYIIEPYILGALIGDACLTGSSPLISIHGSQMQIHEEIIKRLPDILKTRVNINPTCPQYYITQDKGNKTNRNPYTIEIEKLKLDVKSGEKFIPTQYLHGSIDQRLELLRGLMDTDGSADKNRINFHTTSKRLSEDISELVQSLGGQAIVKFYDRSKENKSSEWRVNVRMMICPFHLDAKKAQWWPAKRNYPSRYIKSVELDGNEEQQCISVASPDHTYVVEHYIVTHNTLSAMAYAAKNKLKTLVICPASLKLNWRNEIKEFTNENAYVYKYKAKKKSKDVLHTQDESIFHIINYESLDTYLKFEYKHKCKNKKCKWECDDLEKAYTVCPGCTLRGTITSKINGVIGFGDKAGIMLDPANYDLVVLDEAHYIKSPTANRTKLIKKAFLEVPKKILISGTAIKNRPMELFSLLNFLDGKDWNNSHAFGVRYAAGFDGPWGWDFGGASNLDELFTRISSFFLRRLKKDVLKFLPPKTFTNIPLELSEAEYREYKKVEKGIVEQINAETGETTETLTHHLANIHKLKMFTSKIKVNNAIEMIQDIIDADEKVVVFSQYVDIANKIKEHFGDTAVLFTGKNNITEKQAAVDGFQKNNKIKIFSGTIGAAGVGITLTAASKLIFVDSAWSPSDMEQASDRIHRASSTASNIQIIKFICEDTIDEDIEDLLLEKERVIGKALDNTVVQRKIGVADGSIFKDLISRIKQKS